MPGGRLQCHPTRRSSIPSIHRRSIFRGCERVSCAGVLGTNRMRTVFKRPRVAFFTTLPPAKTGTADYGAALAAELEKIVSLSVYEKAPAGFDPSRFDHVVYQIGNNPYHAGIYEL